MFSAKVKLVSRIPELEKNLRRKVEEAVAEAAQDTAIIARQLAPYKTGDLRESITAYRNTRDNWIVGASVDYAGYVEYGTSMMEAQPYLRPAAEAVKPRLIKKLTRMRVL